MIISTPPTPDSSDPDQREHTQRERREEERLAVSGDDDEGKYSIPHGILANSRRYTLLATWYTTAMPR
jgi:hypothetical protein